MARKIACCLAMLTVLGIRIGLAFGQIADERRMATYVKVIATASKTDAAGNQAFKVRLLIQERFYVLGRQVPEDFGANQFEVITRGAGKVIPALVSYPPGSTVEDKVVGNYSVYRGEVIISGVARRAPGDKEALEVSVRMSGGTEPYRF